MAESNLIDVAEMLAVKGVAERLGVSRNAVYEWVRAGKLRPELVLGRILIRVSELERFMASEVWRDTRKPGKQARKPLKRSLS